MISERKIKVIMVKPAPDSHNIGAKFVARALMDAGMEVIYAGYVPSPKAIAQMALEEDADVLGMSILSGAHNFVLPKVMQALRDAGVDDILVIAGGIIPLEDRPALKEAGIAEIFGPGALTSDIVNFIKTNIRK